MKVNKLEDIWERIHILSEEECWPWRLSKSTSKYGQFNMSGKNWPAHRAAFYAATGIDPKGKLVCHSCDNTECCNPKHLWLGTYIDNLKDCIKKGRYRNGRTKLTIEKVIYIKALIKEGIKNIEISRIIQCDPSTVLHIKKGRQWKNVV